MNRAERLTGPSPGKKGAVGNPPPVVED